MTSPLIQTINANFHDLKDPRRPTLNQRHNFTDIFVIAICGVICGANAWTAIEKFGKAKEKWFRTFLELPYGIPSHDVFNSVFMKLDTVQFEKCFISWVSDILTLIPGSVISVDGKTMRRSHDRSNDKPSTHIVSAWSTTNELVLGQVKTEEKSNEITAIPKLLELLSIKGCLVTIDAMGCQKKITETIIEKDGDYLIAVKENQPSLYSAIEVAFFNGKDISSNEVFTEFAEQENKGHGRIEKRRCWVCQDVSHLNLDISGWDSIKTAVIIESTRTLSEKTSVEYRYYISSSKGSAEYFLASVREHWQVESMHWCLDMAFREDESRVRKQSGPENLSLLRKIALNLLKKEKTLKVGIETKRLNSGWDEKYLLKVLGGMTL